MYYNGDLKLMGEEWIRMTDKYLIKVYRYFVVQLQS